MIRLKMLFMIIYEIINIFYEYYIFRKNEVFIYGYVYLLIFHSERNVSCAIENF